MNNMRGFTEMTISRSPNSSKDKKFFLREERLRGYLYPMHLRARLLGCAVGVATALATSAVSAQTAAAPSAPAPAPMTTPAMSATLGANPSPFSVDLPDWLGPASGKLYVTGAVTGLTFYQDNAAHAAPGDVPSLMDLSSGQVFLQKTDGWFQYFVQVGGYSLPALGAAYVKASTTTPGTFGLVPQAFIKIAPSDSFSIEAGKLPTLIGDEYTWSFENMNIERGLLWNQENAVNQGVQVNYTAGPLAFSLTWNDGMYSGRMNWLWGSAIYTIDGSNTLALVGGGNLGHTGYGKAGTSVALNNEDIYNLIYTYSSGPWTISPYLQYTDVPSNAAIGITKGASTLGEALLVKYSFDDNWNVGGRVEYISESGKAAGAPNLLYGKGSNAWSFTLTPTYQWKTYFIRPEVSYVTLGSGTAGSELGPIGKSTSQTRFMLETGILF